MQDIAVGYVNEAGNMPATARHARYKRRGVVTVEAAMVLPVLVILMLGVWEVGRLIQMTRTLHDAAREGARYAAGGISNGTPVTTALVQTAVQNYLTGAGVPSAAATAATVQITATSPATWTNPCDANPLDQFSLTVTIPAGAAFSSLFWGPSTFTGLTQLSSTVVWLSNNDADVTVNTQLPF